MSVPSEHYFQAKISTSKGAPVSQIEKCKQIFRAILRKLH
jgi:hypothetical protein